MLNPTHPSDEQLERYSQRRLPAVELLVVDDHLLGCEACRARIAGAPSYAAAVRALYADLGAHLEYEEVVACAEGRPSIGSARHLVLCEPCRAEVADLRHLRAKTGLSRRWWIPLAAAAGIGIVAGFLAWNSQPAGPLPKPRPVVLSLERPPVLDRLVRHRSQLLGASPVRTFELTAPVGTTVLTDRPTMRWTTLPGASGYVVSIFDENFNKVLESKEIAGTSWTPESPLPRGQVLIWQVTAHNGSNAILAPTPPDPEARFEVIQEADGAQIEAVRRERPVDHRRIAELCVAAGALQDGDREADALAASDPAGAKALHAAIARLRGQ
jgi:hypothetical protein